MLCLRPRCRRVYLMIPRQLDCLLMHSWRRKMFHAHWKSWEDSLCLWSFVSQIARLDYSYNWRWVCCSPRLDEGWSCPVCLIWPLIRSVNSQLGFHSVSHLYFDRSLFLDSRRKSSRSAFWGHRTQAYQSGSRSKSVDLHMMPGLWWKHSDCLPFS